MAVDVYDKDGRPQSWEWLLGQYGHVEHLKPGTPSPTINLVRIDETEGPQTLVVQTLNAQGLPWAGVMVVLSWPSLESPSSDLPDLTRGDRPPKLWTGRGVAQFTDMNGQTGFGLGKDSWIKDLAAGGPYQVWVFHKDYGSECLAHVGWLGGTNHRGPNRLTFKLGQASVTPPPEPGGDDTTDDTTLAAILSELRGLRGDVRSLAQHLGYHPAAERSGAMP